MSNLYLSPTSIERFTNCPRSWHYHYVLRYRPKVKAATLYVGILLHECFNAIVKADVFGMHVDPVKMFQDAWAEALANNAIRFSTTQTPEGILASATRILELFPDAWKRTGLIPVMDQNGEPVLERELRARLLPDLVLLARLDGLFMSVKDGSIVPLDFKAPAAEPHPIFTSQSDQLTAQQIVVAANADSLGIEKVDRTGFMVALRRAVPKTARGKGPEILPPSIVPARTPEQVAEFRQRVVWVHENIQAGRFPKTPRMAHNSPCNDCDFGLHCAFGSCEGLEIPAIAQAAIA